MNNDLKKNKLQNFLCGFSIILSVSVSGQYLKPNSITLEPNAGFKQQQVNLFYRHSIGKFQSDSFTKRNNQIFLGVGVGSINFRYNNSLSKGSQLNFSFTNVMIRTNEKEENEIGYRYIGIKVGINRFNEMKIREYDDYVNYTGHIFLTDRQIKSTDIELNMGRLVKLNSQNFIKVGCYIGARIANYYYTETTQKNMNTTSKNIVIYNIAPFILGVSLGYQINFGNKK